MGTYLYRGVQASPVRSVGGRARSEREVVLSEAGLRARKAAATFGAPVALASVSMQHGGSKTSVLVEQVIQRVALDRLGHGVCSSPEEKNVINRSRMTAADCSGGCRLQSTRRTSNPAWINRSVACR
jgi:hypothetical protein